MSRWIIGRMTSSLSSAASLLSIPDSVVYSIIRFAVPQWATCHLICHRLALVSKEYRCLQNEGLWNHVLGEYQTLTAASSSGSSSAKCRSPTRISKRLKLSPKYAVARAHQSLHQRMEYAHLALTELTHQREQPLTVKRLRAILERWKPLRVNQRAEVGGTLLIECIRARFVHEKVILECARLLIQEWSAQPDVATGSGPGSGGAGGLTPLCIAAARGMPSVVAYLLDEAKASASIAGEGRFKLWGNQHKTVAGSYVPAEWASKMLEAEEAAGVAAADLKPLRKCIELFRGPVR